MNSSAHIGTICNAYIGTVEGLFLNQWCLFGHLFGGFSILSMVPKWAPLLEFAISPCFLSDVKKVPFWAGVSPLPQDIVNGEDDNTSEMQLRNNRQVLIETKNLLAQLIAALIDNKEAVRARYQEMQGA